MDIEFVSEGMTCAGCVRSVTRALQKVDPKAEVRVDLAEQRVHVRSDFQDSDSEKAFAAAIEQAGYPVKEAKKRA